MNGDREPASAEILRILDWFDYYSDRIEEAVKNHDFDQVKVWCEDLDKRHTRLREVLKECDQRIDYGEDWDQ